MKELPILKYIHPEGYRFLASFGGVSVLLAVFGFGLTAKLFLLLTLFTAYFFRDPER